VQPPKSPMAKAFDKMEREEVYRSYSRSRIDQNGSIKGGNERKLSVLEKTLSVLGDISARGAGGGIATKPASPIAARRDLGEHRLSYKS
jgi:hypothetical protein